MIYIHGASTISGCYNTHADYSEYILYLGYITINVSLVMATGLPGIKIDCRLKITPITMIFVFIVALCII